MTESSRFALVNDLVDLNFCHIAVFVIIYLVGVYTDMVGVFKANLSELDISSESQVRFWKALPR